MYIYNSFISCAIIKLCPHQKVYNMHARKKKKMHLKNEYKCEYTRL